MPMNIKHLKNNIILVSHPYKPNLNFVMDSEDINLISYYLWFPNNRGVIIRGNKCSSLAKLIMKTEKAVKYKNNNKRDLRKSNLIIREMLFNRINETTVECKNSITGATFLISLCDLDKVKNLIWVNSGNYISNHIVGSLHRYLMDYPKDKYVDHISRIGTDNRRENLRLADFRENTYNSYSSQNAFSKYKGVFKCRKKYRARIKRGDMRINIGTFDNEIDAAKAYDEKAKELFGEFAYLNFGKNDGN